MSRDESGAVTAEAAMVLPMLAVFTLGLAWLVSIGVTQVRAIDAARETVRVVARGEDPADGVALGRRVAPAGSSVQVQRGPDTVVVRLSAPVRGPGGFFAFLPEFTVHAEAVAAQEPTP